MEQPASTTRDGASAEVTTGGRGDHDPDLTGRLTALVTSAPGRLSVAVTSDDGRSWAVDADRTTPSASTIKVPVLVAALRAAQAGQLDLDAPLAIPDERVGGSGPLSLMPSLVQAPLREVLTLMISLSDNDATNAVIELVGTEAVGAVLADVPTRHTRLQRRMMDFAAAERGLQNETCVADLVAILVALREGRLLDAAHTRIALEILRTQQFRDGLPAYLPETVSVASKTGDIFGVRGDVALFERDGHWVVVAVLATDLGDGESDRGTAVLPTFAAIGELAATLL